MIVESYHTHAKGAAFGWWGIATSPTELDLDGDFIQGTEWKEYVDKASSLTDCQRLLWTKIDNHKKLIITPCCRDTWETDKFWPSKEIHTVKC